MFSVMWKIWDGIYESLVIKRVSRPGRPDNVLIVIFFLAKLTFIYLFDVFNIFCVQSSVKEFESIREYYMKCRDICFIHVENIFKKRPYQATEAP